MSFLIRKRKEGVAFTSIAKLAIVSFIVALSISLIDTIWAVYMDSFLNSVVLVSFVSAMLTIVSFISYFIFIPTIEKSSKVKIYTYSLIAYAITYLLFALNTKLYIFIVLAFIITILTTLRVTSLGIIIKDKSKKKELSKTEGLVYTAINTAWVIGPLIAGFISNKYGIPIIFVLSAIFIIIALITFKLSKTKDYNIKKKVDKHIIKNFISFFSKKERAIAYCIHGGVAFWWSLIYLFMPLYIIRSGLNEKWIGYFLFGVALPLILLEFKFGELAGRIGFKKMFKIGYLIPCIIALICFFTNDIYIIMALLILSSIGLSMLESTSEAYFFDITKGKEELKFYGPYNTTIEVHRFLAKIIPACFLIFLPFKFIFLFFSLAMFITFIISFKAKNIVESKKSNKKK